MSVTVVKDKPIEWPQEIIRADTWGPYTIKVPGDYDSAGWKIVARVGGATPFIDMTQVDMTITYDPADTDPRIVDSDGNMIVGLTSVTFSMAFADTANLPLVRDGHWSMRSAKAGEQKTWFRGSMQVTQTAMTGAIG